MATEIRTLGKLSISTLVLCVHFLVGLTYAADEPKYGIVCSDAGAGAYEAFPDVCRMRSGELICVFYAGYGHVSDPKQRLPKGGRIAMCRSKDDGRTWSPAKTIVDTPIDDRDSSIIELPSGDLLVTFMTYDRNRKKGTHQAFTIRSRDGGKTWSSPKPIDTPFTQLEAISTPPRLMPDGRLLLTPYGNNTGDPRSYKHAAVLESRDEGRTWKTLAEVKSAKHFLLEPDLVCLPEGRLLMMMRAVMTSSESTDGGHTWTDPKPVGIAGDCPYLLLTSKNILLCGIRYSPSKKNRSTGILHSTDFGRTWKGPTIIDPALGAYPSMAELPDGRIFVVYYNEGRGSDIRCVYLDVDKNGVRVLPQK
ncbi:MAG: exo-alpha-sialidase [Pirellulales bacterium]|nr:exo-alpha-sialidase [Pirellulales bacterium]